MKPELLDNVPHSSRKPKAAIFKVPESVIALDTSSSDSDSEDNSGKNGKDDAVSGRALKKRKLSEMGVIMPVMDPLPAEELPLILPAPDASRTGTVSVKYCKQFWKAGEFEAVPCGDMDSSSGNLLLLSVLVSGLIWQESSLTCKSEFGFDMWPIAQTEESYSYLT